MKKIIRLTERDLARIVRRVINEQGLYQITKSNDEKAKDFLSSVDHDKDNDYNDYDQTDEDLMFATIMSIPSKSDYMKITNIVKEKTGKHIPYWIDSELGDSGICYGGDGELKMRMFCHITDLGVSGQSEWTKEKCKKQFEDCKMSKNSDDGGVYPVIS